MSYDNSEWLEAVAFAKIKESISAIRNSKLPIDMLIEKASYAIGVVDTISQIEIIENKTRYILNNFIRILSRKDIEFEKELKDTVEKLTLSGIDPQKLLPME